MFDTTLNQHIQIFQTLANLKPAVEQTAGMLVDCLQAGGKIMFCGNGGSAADSQHLASEFVGRFVADRRPLAALALSTDTSALTSIGNDYGFDDIFSRQIMALGKPGDIVVAITTSGNSSNIVKAVTCAQENKIRSIGIFIGHYWCARIEEQLARQMGLFPVAASSHTEAASSCRRRSDNLEAIQAMLNIITTNDLRHTRFYRDVFREGEAELILRLLARRCGVLSAQQKSRIMALPKEKLDRLGDAFLDFTDMADLEAWLKPLN